MAISLILSDLPELRWQREAEIDEWVIDLKIGTIGSAVGTGNKVIIILARMDSWRQQSNVIKGSQSVALAALSLS